MRPVKGDHQFGIVGDVLVCRSGGSGQHYAGRAGAPSSKEGLASGPFLEASELTDHHDEELANLTNELNDLLDRYASRRREDGRQLAVLNVPGGFFLAYTVNEHEKEGFDKDDERQGNVVTIESSNEEIRRALKVRGED